MAVLQLEVKSFEAGRSVYARHLPSDEALVVWKSLRTELVVWSYLGRSALVITLSPTSSSWARFAATESQTRCVETVIDGEEVLLLHIPNCTRAILEDLSTEEDFVRGLLLLASSATQDATTAQRILRARANAGSDERCMCVARTEVLSCEADGRMLLWCGGARDDLELRSFLGGVHSDMEVQWREDNESS